MRWYYGIKKIVFIAFLALIIFYCTGCNDFYLGRNQEKVELLSQETEDLECKEFKKSEAVQDRNIQEDLQAQILKIYCLTENGQFLVPVSLEVNASAEIARIAVEKILAGPPRGTGFVSPIPAGTKIRGIRQEGSILYLDLTASFLAMKSPDQIEDALNILLFTLTDLSEIKSIQLLVDGYLIEEIDGKQLDQPLKRPVKINQLGAQEQGSPATLYFIDQEKRFLVPVTVLLDTGSGTITPKTIIDRLMEGPPPDSGLIAGFPNKVQVERLSESAGLVTLELNMDIMQFNETQISDTLFLNSLILSLTTLPRVERVSLIINGKEKYVLPQGLEVNGPLEPPRTINNICFLDKN